MRLSVLCGEKTINYQLSTINYQLKKNEQARNLEENPEHRHHHSNGHRHQLRRFVLHGTLKKGTSFLGTDDTDCTDRIHTLKTVLICVISA